MKVICIDKDDVISTTKEFAFENKNYVAMLYKHDNKSNKYGAILKYPDDEDLIRIHKTNIRRDGNIISNVKKIKSGDKEFIEIIYKYDFSQTSRIETFELINSLGLVKTIFYKLYSEKIPESCNTHSAVKKFIKRLEKESEA